MVTWNSSCYRMSTAFCIIISIHCLSLNIVFNVEVSNRLTLSVGFQHLHFLLCFTHTHTHSLSPFTVSSLVSTHQTPSGDLSLSRHHIEECQSKFKFGVDCVSMLKWSANCFYQHSFSPLLFFCSYSWMRITNLSIFIIFYSLFHIHGKLFSFCSETTAHAKIPSRRYKLNYHKVWSTAWG